MQNRPRRQWPMTSYLTAWKTFRRLSDENDAITRHLLSRTAWPNRDGLTICDLGCGDGRLLETIVVRSGNRVNKVTLVDPDRRLLQESKRCIQETGLVPIISTHLGSAEEEFPACAQDADVILVIHVVYLLPTDNFSELLEKLPKNKPMYVVLDAPNSVFFSLWRQTAPKYHERVAAAHEFLSSLPKEHFSVDKSEILSTIKNPLEISREDLKNAVLSLLCYCPIDHLPSEVTLAWVEDSLRSHLQNGHVACRSSCYEIIRRASPH